MSNYAESPGWYLLIKIPYNLCFIPIIIEIKASIQKNIHLHWWAQKRPYGIGIQNLKDSLFICFGFKKFFQFIVCVLKLWEVYLEWLKRKLRVFCERAIVKFWVCFQNYSLFLTNNFLVKKLEWVPEELNFDLFIKFLSFENPMWAIG